MTQSGCAVMIGVILLVALSGPAESRTVYVCERPDGTLGVTHFPADIAADPAQRARVITRMRQRNVVPQDPTQCWEMDDSQLLPRNVRPHWRRGPNGTLRLDSTVPLPSRP